MDPVIVVPDIPGPRAPLCWTQAPNMTRCDRRAQHQGRHSWESAEVVHAQAETIVRLLDELIRTREDCAKALASAAGLELREADQVRVVATHERTGVQHERRHATGEDRF